jgi:nucleoside-diphosphate-sugar epimerase
MRVLVTGHEGYLGTVLVPLLCQAGHEVVGLDSGLFSSCGFGFGEVRARVDLAGRASSRHLEPKPEPKPEVPVASLSLDIRDVTPADLEGFDAVVHLAGISNDPLGDLNPACTYDINHRASVHLARQAKAAGVERFVFSSSCSLYGASGEAMVSEEAQFRPLTPYGVSKVLVERDLAGLADDQFSCTSLRHATVYGYSPRLRGDLVVNNLVGLAFTTGEVVLRSDGTPWRPLVHVDDVASAFLAVLDAPRELVHDQAFNVGRTDENYQVGAVAEIVRAAVPRSRVVLAEGAGPDQRCYRVDFTKIAATLSAFRPRWTVPEGVQQLLDAYRRHRLNAADFCGPRFLRIVHIKELLAQGYLDQQLRWRDARIHTPENRP